MKAEGWVKVYFMKSWMQSKKLYYYAKMFGVKLVTSTVLRLKEAAAVHFDPKCNRTWAACLCLVNLLFFSDISHSWGFTGFAPTPFTPHPPHHPPPLSSLFLFLSFPLWTQPVGVPAERKQRRTARRSCMEEEGCSSNIRSFLFKIFNSKPSALQKKKKKTLDIRCLYYQYLLHRQCGLYDLCDRTPFFHYIFCTFPKIFIFKNSSESSC